MKIIISPSKTTTLAKSPYLEDRELLFPNKHKELLAQLRKFDKNDLAKALSIKGNILDNTYTNIQQYSENETFHAFESFDGLVFKHIQKDTYKEKEYEYIQKHVRILDAFYGVLEPGTLIKPYRLDMKAKLGFSLYKHWNVSSYFETDMIINLASNEFSKMINHDMITIHFLQNKNGTFKNQATYAKMARGMFLDFMIQNQISKVDELYQFNNDNYMFNESLSDKFNITFTR